jgi:hypothetical protein
MRLHVYVISTKKTPKAFVCVYIRLQTKLWMRMMSHIMRMQTHAKKTLNVNIEAVYAFTYECNQDKKSATCVYKRLQTKH